MRNGRVSAVAALALFLAAAVPAGEWDADPVRAILAARRRATLFSEVSLPIRRIHRQMGESFAAGDVLLEFDDTLPAANLEASRAALRAAQASLEAVSSMFTRKNASRVDLEVAKRENTLAETKFKLSEYEIAACVIRAPFAGRIEAILVNEHELVGRGEKLMVLVDDTVLRAQFLAPEEDYRKLAIGDRITLVVAAAGETVTGVLSHVAAVFDPASQTFDVWADVDNAEGKLRAGMNALVLEHTPGG